MNIAEHITTVGDFLRWCQSAPPGTQLPAHSVARMLELAVDGKKPSNASRAAESGGTTCEWTWREKLWLVPAETRIGTAELAEALGRPKSWVYARTQAGAVDPVPHRKLDGTLTFAVGEVRAWIREREEVLVGGPMESTEAERRSLLVI